MSQKNIVFRLIVLVIILCTSLPVIARTPSKEREKIRVLFIYGGHEFDEPAMYAMLDSFADVAYHKAEMPNALDLFKPGLEEKYDCIVMYDSFTPRFSFTTEQTGQFKALLERGVGLVVLHHSVWGFNGWEDYADITGCQYFFEDGNVINGVKCTASTWADGQTIDVKIADKGHPITAGTDDFTMVDEVYGQGYLHPDVHVLWTTNHPKSDKAVAWTWKYANSPVFTTLQGHDAQAYNNPNFSRTVHQAIQWTVNQLKEKPAPKATFTAGAARVDINPEVFPVMVSGGYFVRYADKVVDPVFTRAIVLDNGTTSIALVTIDACILDTELCDSIRQTASQKTGIPFDHIVVSATHTHLGGSTAGVLGTPIDTTYSELVHRRTVAAIAQAASNRIPVKIGWGAVSYPEGTFCRIWSTRPDKMRTDPYGEVTVRSTTHPGFQNPDFVGPCGPVNDQLTVISLQTPDGKPFAVYANYPMHFWGDGLDSLSPDYFGVYCDLLEERLGIGSSESGVVLLSNGTSGDQQWRDYSQPNPGINHIEYTARLVEKTESLLNGVQYHDWAPLDAIELVQTFDRQRPDEARLAWAREVVQAMGDRELPEVPSFAEVYACEALFLHETPQRDIPLQALRVGEVGITNLPFEVYGITGVKLAQRSPFDIQMTVELANGGEGYIVPPHLHVFGGYNAWPARSAALIPAAEPEIVEISLSLLEKLAGKESKTPASIETDYSKAVLADKPFAYWRMDNIDGFFCPDSVVGEKRAGTYFPCTAYWLEGPKFTTPCGETRNVPAAHFAGGYVKGNLEGLPQNYSFETWVWNGLDPENRLVTGYIFSRDQPAAQAMTGDHLGIGGTHNDGEAKNRLFLYNGNEKEQILIGKTEMPYKEWVHVAMTREGDQVSLYVNGKLDVQGELPRTFVRDESSVFVGNRSDRFSGLEGRITETAFYDRVLTAEEVEKHWKATHPLQDIR